MSKQQNGDAQQQDTDNGERTLISADTKVTLNFVWSVIAILTPLVSMLFLLYQSVQALRVKIDTIGSTVQAIQLQVNDRWTRQMMVLFATELELRNKFSSNYIVVPNPEEIARRLPAGVVGP